MHINHSSWNVSQGCCEYGTDDVSFEDVVTSLSKCLIPLQVLVGVIWNILAVVVFTQSDIRQLQVRLYLTALAVVDTGYLFSLFVVWVDAVGWPIFHTSGWCQLVVFLSYTCSFLSAWFVVAVTADRYLSVCFPCHRPQICRPLYSRLVILGLCLFSALLFLCTFWTTRVITVPGDSPYTACMPVNDYRHLHLALTLVDTLTSWLIPCVVVVVLNALILRAITRGLYSHRLQTTDHTNPSVATGHPKCGMRDCTLHHARPNGGHHRNAYGQAQANMTRMLLWVTSIYFVLVLPSYAMRLRLLILSFLALYGMPRAEQETREMLIQELCQLLYYSSFVINFALYNLCNAEFRTATVRLCRTRSRQPSGGGE